MNKCNIVNKYCYDDRAEYSKEAIRRIKIGEPIIGDDDIVHINLDSNLLHPTDFDGNFTDCIVTIDLIEALDDE